MKTIIYTDGASRGNPGPGGWGAIVISGKDVKEFGGRENHTTNNRMELRSVIEALKLIKTPDPIVVYSDSQYVIKGITEWVYGWQKKNWKNSQRKSVLNRDLWEELIEVSNSKDIVWKFVQGHAENVGNERTDEIAISFADNKPTKLYSGYIDSYPFKIV